jgi:hypothetical protein
MTSAPSSSITEPCHAVASQGRHAGHAAAAAHIGMFCEHDLTYAYYFSRYSYSALYALLRACICRAASFKVEDAFVSTSH